MNELALSGEKWTGLVPLKGLSCQRAAHLEPVPHSQPVSSMRQSIFASAFMNQRHLLLFSSFFSGKHFGRFETLQKESAQEMTQSACPLSRHFMSPLAANDFISTGRHLVSTVGHPMDEVARIESKAKEHEPPVQPARHSCQLQFQGKIPGRDVRPQMKFWQSYVQWINVLQDISSRRIPLQCLAASLKSV